MYAIPMVSRACAFSQDKWSLTVHDTDSLPVKVIYIFYRSYSNQTRTPTKSPLETVRMGPISKAANSGKGTAKCSTLYWPQNKRGHDRPERRRAAGGIKYPTITEEVQGWRACHHLRGGRLWENDSSAEHCFVVAGWADGCT